MTAKPASDKTEPLTVPSSSCMEKSQDSSLTARSQPLHISGAHSDECVSVGSLHCSVLTAFHSAYCVLCAEEAIDIDLRVTCISMF